MRAALDTLGDSIATVQIQVKAIATSWPGWLQTAEQLDPELETATLIEIHNASADAFRQLVDGSAQLIEALGSVARTLDQAGGGTRQRVLASLLRTDARGLTDVAATFSVAARELSISENYQLDASNRKVRGLRTRINRRQVETAERLHMEADLAASSEISAEMATLEARITELDELLQQLLVQITEQWETVQRIDVQVVQRRIPELDREAQQRRLEVLDEELSRVEQQLAELAEQAIYPDQIDTGLDQQTVSMVAGNHRMQHSTLAGLAAALLMGGMNWLLSRKQRMMNYE
jgi:hypothetical protein